MPYLLRNEAPRNSLLRQSSHFGYEGRKLRIFGKEESERLVRAVAERRGLGLLALAQGDFFFFSYCKLDRLEPGSLVGPVTERLVP